MIQVLFPAHFVGQQWWRTYSTLTDIEAVFRSLKSELGLRPIYHHKPIRAEGHLFITVGVDLELTLKRLRK